MLILEGDCHYLFEKISKLESELALCQKENSVLRIAFNHTCKLLEDKGSDGELVSKETVCKAIMGMAEDEWYNLNKKDKRGNIEKAMDIVIKHSQEAKEELKLDKPE